MQAVYVIYGKQPEVFWKPKLQAMDLLFSNFIYIGQSAQHFIALMSQRWFLKLMEETHKVMKIWNSTYYYL